MVSSTQRLAAIRRGALRAFAWLAIGLVGASARPAFAQQTTPPAPSGERTTITGTIKDAATGLPIQGVNVAVFGTPHAAVSNEQGVYTIVNVPTGNIVAIEARRLGYGQARKDNLRVTGTSMQVDIELNSNPLMLEAITASATVDPTSGVKAPIQVSKLTAEHLPVPAMGSAATMLAGKVSGVQVSRSSGEPGAGAFVQLRTPTSPFKSNSPLYVIDGVPLSDNSFLGTITMDFESMNMESIEIIKGAAAAALYGSRGANGVISIRTNRGKSVQFGKSQFTVKSQYTADQYATRLQKIRHHNWRTNALGQWVDVNGNVVPRSSRVADADGIIDNSYTSFYDNVGQVFHPGTALLNSVSLAQSSAATNMNISFDRNWQSGSNIEAQPFTRNNFRATLDHNFRDDVTVGLSVTHTRTTNNPDQLNYTNLFRLDPDVNLLLPNSNGQPYRVFADSASTVTNPLYLQHYRDRQERRVRSLVNTNVNYRPISWLSLTGDFSYDRNDRIEDYYTPPGIPNNNDGGMTVGNLSYQENEGDTHAASASATFLQSFSNLTARLTAKGETQRERALQFTANGENFAFAGLRDMAAALTQTTQSSSRDIRTTGGFTSLALDYSGRYLVDALVRREGSSLFGPQNRWHNYYRVAGSYILSSEPWFVNAPSFLQDFSTMKLRYSVGSAGNRPDFADQYPVLDARVEGLIRDDLGNPFLEPEKKLEHDAGVDLIYRNRLSLSVNYSRATVKNTLVSVAVPSATGFNTATQNVGSSRGETWEGTIEGAWINRRNFRWSTNLVLDRSKETQLAYNRPCYIDTFRWRCDGIPLSTMWGRKHAYSTADLPQDALTQAAVDQFQVNDEGYLVWVGAGNTWADGIRKNLWGTSNTIGGTTYRWGEPFARPIPADAGAELELLGDGQPDFNFGFGNTLTWRGVRFYGLLRGRVGGQLYNLIAHNTMTTNDWHEMDQTGKADTTKKTAQYYSRGVALSGSDYSDSFLESGSFMKFSEANVSYTFNRDRFGIIRRVGAERVTVDLIGRDLFTWSKFKGLDPEIGSAGTPIIDADYPISRSFTLGLSFIF
jgi:TonB-linked SusC/RagA family outer membrane protein